MNPVFPKQIIKIIVNWRKVFIELFNLRYVHKYETNKNNCLSSFVILNYDSSVRNKLSTKIIICYNHKNIQN